jgi:uncharacterized protein (TIGR02118 family)
MYRLVMIYNHPTDAEEFERYRLENHMALAAKVPGIQGVMLGKVVSTVEGGPPPFYRVNVVTFDSDKPWEEVINSPEHQTALEDVKKMATGGFMGLIVDYTDVVPGDGR